MAGRMRVTVRWQGWQGPRRDDDSSSFDGTGRPPPATRPTTLEPGCPAFRRSLTKRYRVQDRRPTDAICLAPFDRKL